MAPSSTQINRYPFIVLTASGSYNINYPAPTKIQLLANKTEKQLRDERSREINQKQIKLRNRR